MENYVFLFIIFCGLLGNYLSYLTGRNVERYDWYKFLAYKCNKENITSFSGFAKVFLVLSRKGYSMKQIQELIDDELNIQNEK